MCIPGGFWLTRARVLAARGSTVGLSVVAAAAIASGGCSLFNRAQARLDEAQEQRERGEKILAVETLRSVITTWPESAEAAKARELAGALEVEVVSDQVLAGDYSGAAASAVKLERGSANATTAAGLARVAQGSPEFAAALQWLHSDSDDVRSRAALAIDLRTSAPSTRAEIDPWLAAHIGEAKEATCLGPIARLDTVDDLGALDTLATECQPVATYSPNSDAGMRASRAIQETIPERREAIKRSPAFRTMAALQTCRDYRVWVLKYRERLRGMLMRGVDPMSDRAGFAEMERRMEGVKKSVEYLIGRMQSMPQDEAWYQLARAVDSDCASP